MAADSPPPPPWRSSGTRRWRPPCASPALPPDGTCAPSPGHTHTHTRARQVGPQGTGCQGDKSGCLGVRAGRLSMACGQRANQGQAETSPWQQNTFPRSSSPGPRVLLASAGQERSASRFACWVDARGTMQATRADGVSAEGTGATSHPSCDMASAEAAAHRGPGPRAAEPVNGSQEGKAGLMRPLHLSQDTKQKPLWGASVTEQPTGQSPVLTCSELSSSPLSFSTMSSRCFTVTRDCQAGRRPHQTQAPGRGQSQNPSRMGPLPGSPVVPTLLKCDQWPLLWGRGLLRLRKQLSLHSRTSCGITKTQQTRLLSPKRPTGPPLHPISFSPGFDKF